MPRDALANPLVEPLLGVLLERPAHPYQLAEALGARARSRATVYDLVRSLVGAGWVENVGVEREGARPERTVYRLTDTGQSELARRIGAAIRVPDDSTDTFGTALEHLGVLGRRGATHALRERAHRLRERIDADAERLRVALEEVPRLFVIEAEYAAERSRAELRWVESVLAEIESGSLAWPRRRRT